MRISIQTNEHLNKMLDELIEFLHERNIPTWYRFSQISNRVSKYYKDFPDAKLNRSFTIEWRPVMPYKRYEIIKPIQIRPDNTYLINIVGMMIRSDEDIVTKNGNKYESRITYNHT